MRAGANPHREEHTRSHAAIRGHVVQGVAEQSNPSGVPRRPHRNYTDQDHSEEPLQGNGTTRAEGAEVSKHFETHQRLQV